MNGIALATLQNWKNKNTALPPCRPKPLQNLKI